MSLRPSPARRTQDRAEIAPPSDSHVGLRRRPRHDDLVDGEPARAPIAYLGRDARLHADLLQVSVDGSWFVVGEARVDIARRPVLRRVLAALVAHHANARHRPLTMNEVLAAGWPNERCVGDSGAARVYQTVKRLRQLGLGAFLDHDGRGYWLKGQLHVVGSAASAA